VVGGVDVESAVGTMYRAPTRRFDAGDLL
jgi:hypothetical protein